MNKEETPQAIVFGIFKNEELVGWRQDTFVTLGKNWAKVYRYTKEQVDIILKNVKSETNYAGTSLMKVLGGMTNVAINASTGESIAMSSALEQVTKQETALRELEEFELRVYPLPVTYEEWYEITSDEQWRIDNILNNLGNGTVEPLEVHKFQILKDEN